MLNKRILLASRALATVLASGSPAQAGDIYFSFLGGANFQQDRSVFVDSFSTSASSHVDPNTGFVLGAAVGTHLDRWLRGLRAEIEAAYRRNEADGNWFVETDFIFDAAGPLDANISTFAVLANVWYDIDVGHKWVPYLGGGVGWGRTKFNGALVDTSGFGGTTTFSGENSGFVYQIGGGINYEVQEGVSLGIGYRMFRGPEIKNNVFVGKNGNVTLPVHGENENHSVLISLTINTN
jgi:opacity protein-like surface antigen